MPDYSFVTIDPGHFHAALVQKEMYPNVSPTVHVYAPLGPDLLDYLTRISRFNNRPENPTAWELEVHAAPDFLERMARERTGNIAVFSGRNRGKIDRIVAALEAGFNVLADKPWIIRTQDLPALQRSLDLANEKGLIAYDIMTERFEITSILQRELINSPEIFGAAEPGTPSEPGVYMESVHHILKMVAGLPNPRPAWFFDIDQQGEALSDVGTHLVDLVQWSLFPDSAIDYRTDIRIHSASRWPTAINPAGFQALTGANRAESFDYYCNTRVNYELRGIHVKLDVLWNWEALQDAGDTHLAVFRGTRSTVEVRQGATEHFLPQLYVISDRENVWRALTDRVASWQSNFPGVGLEDLDGEFRISIPDSYRVGHEAHFAQVTSCFLSYIDHPKQLPTWENQNMLAKYYVTTSGVEMSRK